MAFGGFLSGSRAPWQGRHAAVSDSRTWKGMSTMSPRPGPMMHPNAARCRHWAHLGLPGHMEQQPLPQEAARAHPFGWVCTADPLQNQDAFVD